MLFFKYTKIDYSQLPICYSEQILPFTSFHLFKPILRVVHIKPSKYFTIYSDTATLDVEENNENIDKYIQKKKLW